MSRDSCVRLVQETLEKGTSFGAPSLHENTLAKMVIDAVPSVEMVRFTNSGTEVKRLRDCLPALPALRALFALLTFNFVREEVRICVNLEALE